MSTSHPPFPLVLVLNDQGSRLLGLGGGPTYEIVPGEGASPWVALLREQAPKGGDICLVMGQSSLTVSSQDAPRLSSREIRDAARRIAAGDPGGGGSTHVAGTLDTDPTSPSGHQLWVASHPLSEIQAWDRQVRQAGLDLVFAAPWARLVLRGLEDQPELPEERVVLSIEPGLGRLCFFRGRALLLTRGFRLPEGDDDAMLELVFEEVGRAIQYFKQKYRGQGFDHLLILGIAELPAAMLARLQGGLRLKVRVVAEGLEAILRHGLKRERESRSGLNLVPVEILEARKHQISKGLVWAAGTLMVALLVGVGLMQSAYEGRMRQEVARAQEALDQRKEEATERLKVVEARLPLLRLRLAEHRQAEASNALARASLLLMTVPEGLHLERVDIRQSPGEGIAHVFSISGTALTGPSFSVGPLAEYLRGLQGTPGVTLSPLREVSVSDLVATPATEPVARAVTRFSFEGSVQ